MSLGDYNPNKYFDVYGKGQTPNPFYSIANQFVPRNFHDIIKWSRYILTQSPTTVEVIRKFATYPITDFQVDSGSSTVRDKYQELIKSIRLKNFLNDVGFDYYTLGNVYVSIYFPIQRMLVCPSCGTEHDARTCDKLIKFKRYEFHGECSKCTYSGKFERVDRKSKDIDDINLVKWPAEHVSVNHNPITGESEYYYKFPNATKRRIMTGDPNFISTVPWSMIEAVKNNQDFKFDKKNLYHMKTISMGDVLEGLGMPPVISLYSSIFHQTLLKRANEAIATEHMTPFRILFPQQSSAMGDPISMMSLGNFVKNMEDQMKKFKGDPNHVTIAPVPVGYSAVGGQGRALLVSQELQFIEESILMGMGVSRELLSGTTNWTSSTVGLRLLDNSMNDYTTQVQELIDWIMSRLSTYLNMTECDVTLTPFELLDDDVLKQALPAMMQQGIVSETTALKAFGIDFNEEQEQIRKDRVSKTMNEIQTEHEVKSASFMKSKDVESEQQDDNGYRNARDQAYKYASHIIRMGSQEEQSSALFALKNQDPTLYNMTVEVLSEYSQIRQSTREEEREDIQDVVHSNSASDSLRQSQRAEEEYQEQREMRAKEQRTASREISKADEKTKEDQKAANKKPTKEQIDKSEKASK